MKLSTLYTAVPEYIEFAWVTAPNAAAQSITSNTITTLTLDAEVADTGNLVSAPSSNQFTLPAGTYYFEITVPVFVLYGAAMGLILETTSGTRINSSITKVGDNSNAQGQIAKLKGQFNILSSTSFQIRALVNCHDTLEISGRYHRSFEGNINFSVSTPLLQRTTIKLWKLA